MTTNKELFTRIELALDIAADFAYTDGAHHKNWVINEMIRALEPDEKKRKDLGWEDSDWLDQCIAP